jgi:AmmeMemoRadiSam system protein A
MMTNEQGMVLLRLARAAIAARFGITPPPTSPEAWLNRPGATFITLKEDGMLRGCIGSLEARRPLGEDVQHNAEAAAFRDPRFLPLAQEELEHVSVEVSVLSEARPMDFYDERDALAQLQPGVDGMILEYGLHRATFLPQVWEDLPQPAQFMARLKNKAGLAEGFWSDDIRLSRYTVQKFSEA